MTIDSERLGEQIKESRIVGGRFERLVNGEWVEWPVLSMDKLGHDEAKRIIARSVPRRAQP